MTTGWLSDLPVQLQQLVDAPTPQQAVQQLVDTRLKWIEPLSPPVNLEMVASACGVNPAVARVTMHADARLVPIGDAWCIQVNAQHDERRHRFSIAHEITHKVIIDATVEAPLLSGWRGFKYQIKNRDLEFLCNTGARHILLLRPERLRPLLNKQGFCEQAVRAVEQNYDVSFEAAVRSLAETALEQIAVAYLAMGYRKSEISKVQQLALLPEYAPTPEAKLRVVRSYVSPSFSIYIPYNKSVPLDSWITECFFSGCSQKATEILTFNDREYYRYTVEAIPRSIYVSGEWQQGIIVLLSEPSKVDAVSE